MERGTVSLIDSHGLAGLRVAMPRSARVAPGGMVFHALNRGVGRMRLFEKPQDYQAFEDLVAETLEKCPLRICAHCLLPNHWHMVVWPERDGEAEEKGISPIKRCCRPRILDLSRMACS